LRHAFEACFKLVVDHHTSSQVFTNKRQQTLILYLDPQLSHQQVVIYSIKELGQINIDGKFALLFDDISDLQDRLFGIPIRSKAEAISREERVKQRRENLSNSLLYHTINDVRDTQFAFTAIGFVDLYASDC